MIALFQCVRPFLVVVAYGCLTLFLAGADAGAQPYPHKIIRVISPAAPGGNSDIIFRLLAGKMGEILGQPLVADYRPGAGGRIGSELTVRSAPDGYTVALPGAYFVINPALVKNLPFDTFKDFTPLGLIVEIPASVVLHPSLPVKNVAEFLRLAKSRPQQIFFSSSGAGAVGHLAGELLNVRAGLQLVHVPYKGVAPAVIDLMAGHVGVSFPSIPVVINHVRGGKLRMIAVCSSERVPTLPQVATMHESGVKDFFVSSGFMFVGPAGMPPPVVEKFNGALVAALQDPVIRRELLDSGAVPVGNTPQQHAAYIRAEIEKWIKVVDYAGIPRE